MFKLAGHLGMTVGRLMAELSEDELTEWLAYDQLDPIGSYRSDVQTALLAYVQSGDPQSSLDDFILYDPNPLSDEERAEQEHQKQAQERQANVQAMKDYFAHLTKQNS